jgi:sortase A
MNFRWMVRLFGLFLSLSGIITMGYFFFPIISWQLYLAPVFAAENIATPIPKATVLNQGTFASLARQTTSLLLGVNYYNAATWFPSAPAPVENAKPQVTTYRFSVPKLKIVNAIVSTVDSDLASHLVNYPGTAVPPNKGNAVIFGHSTLPQLYNPKDYKTIFANAHTLQTGDIFKVSADGIEYTYKIFSISIIEPEDTSVLTQSFDDSYLTVITCTPPGTIWKRLVLKAKLEKL